MCQPKSRRLASAIVLAAALVATPALAAPAPDAGAPEVGALQVLADWWAELTEPVLGFFASSTGAADADDDPVIETTADGPDADAEGRPTYDPNG
ncbi:MAG: hypothetical protein ACOC92_01180 [bacterium]